MSGLLHIASLLVHHRAEASTALDSLIDTLPVAELAMRDSTRSIVLCEGQDESQITDCIDALGQVQGVIGVSLVHHHAEAAESLMEDVENDHAS
ncbi:chaperone NapD [Alkalisalibacterium limincola]|uniref:chaperone NapD n=1 Tax=Alkalisalibacterium limincola TaxID=2699169 RepID=UPI00164FB599|nr:chaperone NapD [Alkalisalibacterium limincola]